MFPKRFLIEILMYPVCFTLMNTDNFIILLYYIALFLLFSEISIVSRDNLRDCRIRKSPYILYVKSKYLFP
jgi:hypothetical protein